MRDFPFFTTESGVSSLILKEIPYRAQAYIHIRDVQPEGFAEHLRECVSFCRICGAEAVFAQGSPALEGYPLYTRVWELRAAARPEADKTASLFPVTEQTVSQWRSLYNQAMRRVDNAATLEARDEKRIVNSGGAYFVHQEGTLLGIFWLEDNRLLAVAALQKGAGERIIHTAFTLLEGGQITLEVASTNEKALRLYERLGFVKTREVCCWYEVGQFSKCCTNLGK